MKQHAFHITAKCHLQYDRLITQVKKRTFSSRRRPHTTFIKSQHVKHQQRDKSKSGPLIEGSQSFCAIPASDSPNQGAKSLAWNPQRHPGHKKQGKGKTVPLGWPEGGWGDSCGHVCLPSGPSRRGAGRRERWDATGSEGQTAVAALQAGERPWPLGAPGGAWGRWGIRWTASFQGCRGKVSSLSHFRLFSKCMTLSNTSFKADVFLIKMNLRLTI